VPVLCGLQYLVGLRSAAGPDLPAARGHTLKVAGSRTSESGSIIMHSDPLTFVGRLPGHLRRAGEVVTPVMDRGRFR